MRKGKMMKSLKAFGLALVALALFTFTANAQTVVASSLNGGTSAVVAGTNTSGDFTFGVPRARAIAVQAQCLLVSNATNNQGTLKFVLQNNVKGTNWVTWGITPVTLNTNFAGKQLCFGMTNFDSVGFSNWRGYFENGTGVTLTNVDVSIATKSGL